MADPHLQTLTEGAITLEGAARAIQAAPILRGVVDRCEVRSVLVMGQSGRWVNHCTVLHVGSALPPLPTKIEDRIMGNARLIGSATPAGEILTQAALIDSLTVWRIGLPEGYLESVEEGKFGPAVQPPPWQFQQTGNAYHHPSKNEWGAPPCWTIDLHDRHGMDVGTVLPRGPFRDRSTSGVTLDVGGLVKNWCHDPTWKQNSAVQNAYRVVIPDLRGHIDRVDVRERRVIVTVARGISSGLECALSATDSKGTDFSQTTAVPEGIVEFGLPTAPRSVEVFLIDESDEWCDHYRLYQPDALSPNTFEIHNAPGREEEPLEQLLAPRYAAVRAQFGKAIQLSTGDKPDYANAAKEAVCAVESIAQVMSGKHQATLGQIVKSLKKEKRIDPSVAATLTTFWSYTNRLPNVRHGGTAVSGMTAKEFEVVLEKARDAIKYFLERDL